MLKIVHKERAPTLNESEMISCKDPDYQNILTFQNSATRAWRSGREVQRANAFVRNDERIGSMVEKIVPPSPPASSRSVRAAMMQTVDSGLISLKTVSNEAGAT